MTDPALRAELRKLAEAALAAGTVGAVLAWKNLHVTPGLVLALLDDLGAADAELARLRAALEVVAKGGCKRFPIWSCLEERRGVKVGGCTRACDPPAVVLRPDYLCDACRAKAALEGRTDG
jgi:hypothetical protein